jgi:large subunit ribosomal protein L25
MIRDPEKRTGPGRRDRQRPFTKEAIMAKSVDLVAETRTDAGKGASRRLRRANKVPAIVYGGGRDPRAVEFDRNQLAHQMENEAFFSSVLNIKIGDKSQPVILKDVQWHPAKNLVLHMDMQRIIADQKIKMSVPIHYLNEETAVGVKMSGGSVSHMINEVEINCLPANLPEYLAIDIGELDLDQTLYLSDLTLPEGVEMPELTDDPDTNKGVVSIHVIKEVVEEEPEELVEGEGLPEGEEAPEDGAEGDDGKDSKDGDGK